MNNVKLSLDALLDQNLHDLVNCTASRYYGAYGKGRPNSIMITQEDLALEGYVGIATAYESFDPSRGFSDNEKQSFRTHIYPYMRNAMLTYCRKFGHSLSISEKSAREDLNTIINIGVIHIDQCNEDEEFDIPIGSGVQASRDIDEYFLIGFTDFECLLVKDHILDGYSLQELSDRHQISKSRAGEIIRGLMDRMRIRAEYYIDND